MNISFNISTPPPSTTPVDQSTPTQQTSTDNRTLTVSITPGDSGDPAVQPTAITLTYPMVGPEDIALNEVAQQLQNLDINSLKGMTTTAAMLLVNQQAGDLGALIQSGGKDFVANNKEMITKSLDHIETQAAQSEHQLFDLINNSTYPDFTKFLKEMLTAAQHLRQIASEAKHNMVLGEFNNILDQAKEMEVEAEKNYESTMKSIKADEMDAIGKIVSGAISIVATAAGGIGAGAGQRMMGGQLGSGVGGALGGIVDGGIGLASAQQRMDAAELKKEADLAGAIEKKYEATAKLLQEGEQITDELRDIGKTLSDMVLKLYQDFISNQNQILQRANI